MRYMRYVCWWVNVLSYFTNIQNPIQVIVLARFSCIAQSATIACYGSDDTSVILPYHSSALASLV